jgi:soluble lytic murein transglycosylase-like protein
VSAVLARLRDVFVEVPAVGTSARLTAATPAPIVVVLCAAVRGPAMASMLALALARALRHPCAVACAVGGVQPPTGLATPGTRRAAARLRGAGADASASGRVVWIDGNATADAGGLEEKPEAIALAACARLRHAAGAAGGPAALALPFRRSPGLDRVLASQDGIVFVREPDATATVVERIGRSLAALGPSVASVAPPTRLAGALASRGMTASASARAAVGQLGFGAEKLERDANARLRNQRGQALLVLVAAMAVVLVAALVLGGVARGIGTKARNQRAADLAALGGARAMRASYDGLFAPVRIDGRPNPLHVERPDYLARARRRALAAAQLNGAEQVDVAFPDGGSIAPTRIRVTVRDPAVVRFGGQRRSTPVATIAEAEIAPGASSAPGPGPGDYPGPFAYRQGRPMRPDVALAFDRLSAAAARDGIALTILSAFRSSAEQARLFAAHPDPRWVAPPGRSLHRLGTELDLGPASAYAWLATHAPSFRFVKRYAWEPWHFGLEINAGTTSVGYGGSGDGRGAVPAFVPSRLAPAIAVAAQRWNVSAALLAAQLYAESGFNPFAVSPAGAQGIAQFMPGTARAYRLADPFDAASAIDAQAHLMRDLLRRFASVPLALAAYNAGPGAVAGCACVPAIAETQAYVARILGLLRGAGDSAGLDVGLDVRLVR